MRGPCTRPTPELPKTYRGGSANAAALNQAGIPYAVVGGNAVASWVATVDAGAVRNTRDVDLLGELAEFSCAAVNLSVTSLDEKLQRVLEPRTSPPQARLDAIRQLRDAGIPVGVMVAPIIPGLTDHDMPKILAACADSGAQWAGYTIMRLPFAVAPLFERWLDEHFPEKKEKILSRIRSIRGSDRLSDPRWGTRIKGEGIFAEQIAALFQMSCRKVGIGPRPDLSTEHFRRPREQLTLFG